ncbi:hypothetical protein KFL_000840230 [Klebsormidium nitens]|uniref:START domain-containing protein n=1 Tax=Klebsormidium nitens TaxID=105231 RepID=A0A1Y1HX86_KLENI|nr:hypothetical protein KFL_000840230 [Klebsormidium nitens]|eukprot:GAQ81581.1 hypothetical protein KFL_000840230 [Klebsormidium nitens]
MVSPSLMSESRQGWLYKLGRHSWSSFQWHKRYFMLNGHQLCYFRGLPQSNQTPAKVWYLGHDCRVDNLGIDNSSGKDIFCLKLYFGLRPNGKEIRPLQLGGRDPEDVEQWYQALKDRIIEPPGNSMRIHLPYGRSLGLSSSTLSNTLSDEDDGDDLPGKRKYGSDTEAAQRHRRTASMDDIPTHSPEPSFLDSGGKPFTRLEHQVSKVPGLPPDFDDPPDVMELRRKQAFAAGPSVYDVAGLHSEPSQRWRLVRLENGLRFYEEIREEKVSNAHAGLTTMKSMGVVDAPCNEIFKLLMDVGSSRHEWDHTCADVRVVEREDGHTDIVHHKLRPSVFPPWLVWPRDLCMARYWMREESGAYVILFRSTIHKDCPLESGYVRANLVSGSFIISPLNTESSRESATPQSLVIHLLELDPCGWLPHMFGIPAAFHLPMLMRVAGIRELFQQTSREAVTTLLQVPASLESEPAVIVAPETPRPSAKIPIVTKPVPRSASFSISTSSLSTPSVSSYESTPFDPRSLRLTSLKRRPSLDDSYLRRSPPSFSSRLLSSGYGPDSAAYQPAEPAYAPAPSAYVPSTGIPSVPRPSTLDPSQFSGTLSYGPMEDGVNSWAEPEPHHFPVRSKTYLSDKRKIPANSCHMHLVATDWLTSRERIDHVAARPDSCVQFAIQKARKDPENPMPFFLIVNLQVPATQQYSMCFYYACVDSPEKDSLLGRFVYGTDSFRNSRFKLIPSIAKGAWVVKRSVGTKPLIVASALKVDYHKAENYLEIDIDIGSSTVANGVVRFVLGYVRSLVIDMAFLVQGSTEDELPEVPIGTVRLCHLEPNAAHDIDEGEAEEFCQT